MRTLKKSLALVLALVMVLGLAVVGASADNAIDKFEDSDQIGDAYLEAVGVLTGLAIVDGMTDTEIAPQGTYQRDQAAKIIAYMVLGKEAADSLVASYAPFQDVPADYWAAGYIAFCKEQGIIDGVSDTSFDPYGTLTGFQWAKMLLAAVGFNANNELEGDSWSLNTARTGHEVGLFDGDNAGADHVALRREQAMLYAFNTLTNVRQVSYTGNGNNYVYDIFGYEWADGTGYTLGYDVFDLKSVEGQIIDNEGMGNSKTVVANANYTEPSRWEQWWGVSDPTTVSIKADTGLDLMYHAVRAWYTGSDTNVYVNDLATVTTYECDHILTVKDLADELDVAESKIGTDSIGVKGQPYEAYAIDNTALDLTGIADSVRAAVEEDYAYITLYASYATKGYDSGSKTTFKNNISGEAWTTETVDNDDIKTDMTDIAYNDDVVTVWAQSTQDTTAPIDCAWYATEVTTTEGAVTDVDKTDDGATVLTLADDTTLELSAFYPKAGTAEDAYVLGQNYVFVLDTHGDVIRATRNNARDLYYFTGDTRIPTDLNAWSSDYYREYRFIDVTTGDEIVVPMRKNASVFEGNYYDVRAVADSNGLYRATEIDENDNVYAAEYAIGDFRFSAATDRATNVYDGKSVFFDVDTITFVVVEGSGEKMTVETYNGIDALAEDYPVSAYSYFDLDNACFTLTGTVDGGKYATTVFVDGDDLTSTSSYIFVPENVDASDWVYVGMTDDDRYLVKYDGAYLEGKPQEVYFVVRNLSGDALERGFYTFVYNADGNHRYEITGPRMDDGPYCAYNNVHAQSLDNTGAHWEFWHDRSAAVDAYNDNVTVVDFYANVKKPVERDLVWLYQFTQDKEQSADYRLAYTVNPYTEEVTTVYVLKGEWHNSGFVSFANSINPLWTSDYSYEDVQTDAHGNYTFTDVTVTYNGVGYETGEVVYFNLSDGISTMQHVKGTATAAADGSYATFELDDFTWNVNWALNKDIEITAVQYAISFDVNDVASENPYYNVVVGTYYGDTMPTVLYFDFNENVSGTVTFARNEDEAYDNTALTAKYDVRLTYGDQALDVTSANTELDADCNLTIDLSGLTAVTNHSTTVVLDGIYVVSL